MAAVDGGVLTFVGESTVTSTAKASRLASMALAGQSSVALPAGQPNFLLILEELAGQSAATAAGRVAYAADLSLVGNAAVASAAQAVFAGEVTVAGEATVAQAGQVLFAGELDISGDAVAAADALEDDEGAADFLGAAQITAAMSVAYSGDMAIAAGSGFVAIGLVRPPITIAAPFPGRLPADPFAGLRTDRPPHGRVEKVSISVSARTQLVDRDETALSGDGKNR